MNGDDPLVGYKYISIGRTNEDNPSKGFECMSINRTNKMIHWKDINVYPR